MAIRLDELSTLLNRIHSGELLHDQSGFYTEKDCGTAACICGWDYAIDFHEGSTFWAHNETLNGELVEDRIWDYSKNKYNLTDTEAILLFHSHSTPELQNATVRALLMGRSLNCGSNLPILSTNSEGVPALILDTEIDEQKINAFFAGIELAYVTPLKYPANS